LYPALSTQLSAQLLSAQQLSAQRLSAQRLSAQLLEVPPLPTIRTLLETVATASRTKIE
jgi:hypothetical protein